MFEDLAHDLRKSLFDHAGRETFPAEISSLLKRHLELDEVSLYVQGQQDDYVRIDLSGKEPDVREADPVRASDPFVELLKRSLKPVVRSSLPGEGGGSNLKSIRERMERLSSRVTVPLLAGGDLVGFINMNCRRGGRILRFRRLEELPLLFAPIAWVLQNTFLREKIRHSQARIRRTDRLAVLGTLTASLAHEIRNPLVSIKTYFQLLPERYEDREFRERFQKVASNEVERLSRLVEDLLTFSRPSNPELRSVDLHSLISEVVTLLEPAALRKKVHFLCHFDTEGGEEILCDPGQMRQVFLNILQNAFDSVDGEGTVFLRTRYDREAGDLGFVHVEIEDTGVGMCEEELGRLFTPFYTTKSSGTGLGLAISRQIVEEHLGSIAVESRPGEGTTFTLHLPKNPGHHERRKEGARRLSGPDGKSALNHGNESNSP